jgi:hypothetical protein
MTELKGEWLPQLLSTYAQKEFFSFIERGNWLIFQDVYPQLSLYKYSLKNKKVLFHLFGPLQISIFMEITWKFY